MTEFPLKETARVTALRKRPQLGREAAKKRVAHVIALLGDNGAMRSVDLAKALGYSSPQSIQAFLMSMIKAGRIERTGLSYHLKGQPTKVSFSTPPTKTEFFEGKGKMYVLRRWLRDHQDEPTTQSKIAREAGYGSTTAANYILTDMLDKKILRRYQNSEDYGFEWRYQFIDPELSGIKVTAPADTALPKPLMKKQHKFHVGNYHHFEDDDCPMVPVDPNAKLYECKNCDYVAMTPMGLAQHSRWQHADLREPKKPKVEAKVEPVEPEIETVAEPVEPVEPVEPEIKTVAAPTIEPVASKIGITKELVALTEKYAKEFFWATGSKDTKELVLWLKERMFAGDE